MNLNGHLLYIDITQVCGIGCSFCMYGDKHNNGASMVLSDRSRENLRTLINSPGVNRICISGEGEPLNNAGVFHEILQMSEGGNTFEFITSGFFPHELLTRFFEETSAILVPKKDICNIRLSSDSYHIEKIKNKPHGFSLQFWLDHPFEGLTLSFRSIDTDRAFTQSYLLSELEKLSIQGKIIQIGPLEDQLIVEEHTFGIDYKNLVQPFQSPPANFLDMHGYIKAIEAKIAKRFTLGSLNKAPLDNGMDVTIKPGGEVYFYGIENILLGNIHFNEFSWERLASHIAKTPLIHSLYTRPFLEMVANISDIEVAQNLIRKMNNPYWLIKELARHDDELLGQMIAT